MTNRCFAAISAAVASLGVLAGCGGQAPASVTPPASQQLLSAAIAYDPVTGGVIAFGGQHRAGRQIGPSAVTWRWTGERWQPVATQAPSARWTTLMATEPSGYGLLLFGGRVGGTYTLPVCPTPYRQGEPCTASASPMRFLPDTWAFADGIWQRLPAGPGTPAQGQMLAGDPAIGAVVLTGQSRASGLGDVSGTWKWTGHGWSLLSATNPEQADSMAYDPVSGRLLAYGGMQPSGPSAGEEGAPATLGYSQTWALTDAGWIQLHPGTTPDRAVGVLTLSPDLRRLLLITTLGQVWAWTGQQWERYPVWGGPAGSAWTNVTLAAATDPSQHQVVLLVTNDGADDQTWTLTGNTWVHHQATP